MEDERKAERLEFLEGKDGTRILRDRSVTEEEREPYDYIDFKGDKLVPPKAVAGDRRWENLRLNTRGETILQVVKRIGLIVVQIAVMSVIFFIMLRNVECGGCTL